MSMLTEIPKPIAPPSAPVSTSGPPKRRVARTGAIAAVLAVLVVIAAGVWWSRAEASTGPRYRTATAGPQHVEQTLSTVATIEPVTQAKVSFPIDGMVSSVQVTTGDRVTAGQTLAQLSLDDLQRDIDDANAKLAQAQLAYRRAADGEQQTSSTPSGSGATGTGDVPQLSGTDTPANGAASSGGTTGTSTQDLVARQAAVNAAAANLATAQQALQQATITSPINGTVVATGIAVGDEVTAASASQAITIVGDQGYELTTEVDVTDLADLEIGQPVTIVPDADPSHTLTGEIAAIAVTPKDNTTSYAVTIAVTGDSTGLRNGGLATTTIVTATADAAIAVPTSALTPQGENHSITVVQQDGTTETRTVTVGAVGDTWTEIRNGLDAGATVALADLDEPLPGSATDSANGNTGNGFPGGGGGFTGGGRFPGGGGGGGGGFGPPGG